MNNELIFTELQDILGKDFLGELFVSSIDIVKLINQRLDVAKKQFLIRSELMDYFLRDKHFFLEEEVQAETDLISILVHKLTEKYIFINELEEVNNVLSVNIWGDGYNSLGIKDYMNKKIDAIIENEKSVELKDVMETILNYLNEQKIENLKQFIVDQLYTNSIFNNRYDKYDYKDIVTSENTIKILPDTFNSCKKRTKIILFLLSRIEEKIDFNDDNYKEFKNGNIQLKFKNNIERDLFYKRFVGNIKTTLDKAERI